MRGPCFVRPVWAVNYMPVGGNPTITLERGEDEDEVARVSKETCATGQEAGNGAVSPGQ